MSAEVPKDANEGCVGPTSEAAGSASACAGCPNQAKCASGAGREVDPAIAEVENKLSAVKHKIMVLSGKGGVGKSTFSTQLAFTLASKGFQVGLLDVDICGPSVPHMCNLVGQEVHQSASGWSPVYVNDNLAVMSIGFMLPTADDAVIWRGPRKNGLIKQFLTDVEWGELDYLIIDTPPGTSDEHISLAQYLKTSKVDGAVVVTTPQEVSMADVRKELNFCKKTSIPVIGIVENMFDIRVPVSYAEDSMSTGVKLVDRSGVDKTQEYLAIMREKCPELLENMCVQSFLFAPGVDAEDYDDEEEEDEASMVTDGFNDILGHEREATTTSIANTTSKFHVNANTPTSMATKFGVTYLGQLPMDRNLMQCCEDGIGFVDAYPDSVACKPLTEIVNRITMHVESLNN